MPTRKGLGAGKGKGFKNIIGQDPVTHSNNARGIKSKVPLQSIQPKFISPEQIRFQEKETIRNNDFFADKKILNIEDTPVGVNMYKVYVENTRKKDGFDLYLVSTKQLVLSREPMKRKRIVTRIGKVKNLLRPVEVFVGNNFGKNVDTKLSVSQEEISNKYFKR